MTTINQNFEKIRVEVTKTGLPAYWESGGGMTNSGECSIVCDRNGQAKRAIYVRRAGHLSNSKHALIPLQVGDLIIDAWHHRKDFSIVIVKIAGFENSENETLARVELVNRYNRGEWDTELPEYLNAAVQAAQNKATCYHCREPFYIIEPRI